MLVLVYLSVAGWVDLSLTLCILSRTVRDRYRNLIYGISMKYKQTSILFFVSVRLVVAALCLFFPPFFDFYIINLWNLVNKITGKPLEDLDILHTFG